MQRDANVLTKSVASEVGIGQSTRVAGQSTLAIIVIIGVIFLALYNLADYPTTWFDEGSHLHVPKTLVRFGVYADYSSEGFRHYGPTIGVGPTVMLPIAGIFRLFGIGLFQARLVMAIYLLAAIFVFYRLAHLMGGRRLAWLAIALLISSRGISLLEYGRQVLGEVPGFFFLTAAFVLWFRVWEQASWRRLGLVGLLFGLAMVTKHQFLLILAPTLGFAWLANLVYYRTAPQRVFLVPGLISAACFTLWQVYLIVYLGPATASENLTMFREFTSGAALVFSADLMKRGLKELFSLNVYLGWLIPVLIYSLTLALPRRREGHQWAILLVLVTFNLGWYVVASIGWLRYAFTGLAVSSLFVARFFYDITDGFQLEWRSMWNAIRQSQPFQKQALRWVMVVWLVAMIVIPLGLTMRQIIWPADNGPAAITAYLNANVPQDAIIETWEPEMGFLSDHNYHFPPPLLLNNAVGYIWLGGDPPAELYDFVQTELPDYVLIGEFARWVELYPMEFLEARYELVETIGSYRLYAKP